MKRTKKILALLLSIASAVGVSSCGGLTHTSDDSSNGSKTKLSVYNYNGGIGTDWAYAAEKRFEELYKDVSFEEGKVGVDVEIVPGKLSQATIATQPYDVFFTESVFFNDLVAQNLLLDITDMVTSPLSNVKGCSETGSIEDKLNDEHKKALTALDGKYYCLPHYECYSGISYDRDLFDSKSLFIQEGTGTTKFTNLSGNLSVGPNGIRGDYDDGLPSSYEEFESLMARMVQLDVVPFIYTGMYSSYTNHLLTGAWAAYTGKDEWMLNVNFNSNADGKEVKTEIITGFNGDEPIIEQMEITEENGYLVNQQAGRYYALSLLESIIGNAENVSTKVTEVLSHLDAHNEYIFSSLEGKPIAMIIEGSYWYAEAKESFAASESAYPLTAKNRNFSFMPLPVQAKGQVTEGNGKKNTLFDGLSSYCFISASIKDNPVKVELAKKWLQFLYTDEELIHFTEVTSNFKGVKYDVDKDMFSSMSKFAANMYDIRSNSDVVHPVSDSKIFVNAQSKFYYNLDTSCFSSIVNGKSYRDAVNAFVRGENAVDYFNGMTISAKEWADSYGKYFN